MISDGVNAYKHKATFTRATFFACDFLIKIDVAKLHISNNGSHCDKSYLTAENDCLKLFPFSDSDILNLFKAKSKLIS